MSAEFARELAVGTTGLKQGHTAGGQDQVQLGRLRSIAVGPERRDDVVGTSLSGVVGYNFLRHYKVVIDYPGEALTFFHT